MPQPAKRNTLLETDPDKYALLRAETMAPYRNIRLFVYAGCGASGVIGGIVFLAQILAGRNLDTSIPNFAVQAGVTALMGGLFVWEQKKKTKLVAAWREKIKRDRTKV
jgi:hypothetical protein